MKALQSGLKARGNRLLAIALKHVTAAKLAAALVPAGLLVASGAQGSFVNVCPGSTEKHCTDGGFNVHNGGSPLSDAPEWFGPNVVKTLFPFNPATNKGGSALYVEQGGGVAVGNDNVLYLMYDYFAPAPGFDTPNSFFDVFFQVQDEDYLARIQGLNVTLFAKPADTPSNVNPDGSFNTGTPWVLADAAELAQVKGAAGFGPSQNSSTPHPMAEFEVTIDQFGFPPNSLPPGINPATGLYDPSPAFWSASAGAGGSAPTSLLDPPISSGVFTLHPDGTTTVTPSLGPNGDPLQQGNVPEPGTLSLLGLAGLGLLAGLRRRQRGR